MGVRRFDLEAGGDEFIFDADTEEKIEFWLSKYPEDRKRSAVIPMLWLAQKDNGGWLSEPAMREVADRLEMPYIRVYEVATFYTMFRLSPVGRYHVQLCGTTPCMLRGANDLKSVCERAIGKKGQVSESGRLSWEEVECLGACANAPIVQINDYYYEDLTTESLGEILEKLENGVYVEPGNFVDRWKSAPEGEAKTLVDAELYDGSRGERLASLPNLPEEMPESNLKPAEAPSPGVTQAEAVKDERTAAERAEDQEDATREAEDEGDRVALEATRLDPEDFKQPEAKEKPDDGMADDLKRISGIGAVLEAKLNSLGIFHFHQISSWGAAEVAWIDNYLRFKGRVLREKWIPQAKAFASENEG